jgi:GH15 family glucan-1,4-alpha-glucosidase
MQPPAPDFMPSAIEDYALIGDCRSAALVGRDGSIDWLCWPRFDSPACFAALLGEPRHGRWLVAPASRPRRVQRRYRGDTLVLETEFETAGGTVCVVDFMAMTEAHGSPTPQLPLTAPRGTASSVLPEVSDGAAALPPAPLATAHAPAAPDGSHLVRLVVGKRGRVRMRMELLLRFDYGSSVPWVTRLERGQGLSAVAGPDQVILRTTTRLASHDFLTEAEFTVAAGESVPFVLSHAVSHLHPPEPIDPREALAETTQWWETWATRCPNTGPWQPMVRRSLITLKALTYAPTGGIVAAPTTSLPEQWKGLRNWDYRYCWLRDATLTLLSLMNAGYFEEAEAWRLWLLRAIAGSPQQAQTLYGLAGERLLNEWELGWLPGYEGAAPVRVGNAAANQLQLDVFGEVLDAMYQARLGGLKPNGADWAVQRKLVDHVEKIWRQPDEGIWEFRSGRRQFTYSKVMAWVALDRAVRSVEAFGLKGPLASWKRLRQRIHDDVCRNGFDSRRGSFVQSYGSHALDASLLLIPITGFLPARDPRVRGTVAAIQRELMVDGLVLRYPTEESGDGLPPGEGVFLACSFWLADNLLLQGRGAEAEEMLQRLIGIANDVGLMGEQYDPASRRHMGNFPQAFSHVALVNTALNLSRPALQGGRGRPAPATPGKRLAAPHLL